MFPFSAVLGQSLDPCLPHRGAPAAQLNTQIGVVAGSRKLDHTQLCLLSGPAEPGGPPEGLLQALKLVSE